MNHLITVLTLVICISSFCQNTYVPDDNFELALIEYGYDTGPLDNYVPTSNINTVIGLDVGSRNIKDLTGIEDFVLLKSLQCDDNQLTNLDVSSISELRHLNCNGNILTSLDISNNEFITVISCNDNQLTSLDLRSNIGMNYIECDNNLLTSLNLSKNVDLASVSCASNLISELDVSKNSELTSLNCDFNKLIHLNLFNNSKLRRLSFNHNAISNIDLDRNIELTELNCEFNNMNELILYYNTNLKILGAAYNNFEQLDLSQNLELSTLNTSHNSLTILDLTLNIQLKVVDISFNQLCTLHIKNGNNTNILESDFNTKSNSNLSCIIVDDPNYSTSIWNLIDSSSNFVVSDQECEALGYGIDDFELSENQIEILNQSAIVNLDNSPLDYLYAIDDNDYQENATFSYLFEGDHTIYVKRKNGCNEKSIVFSISMVIEIPRYFTPNNDGINDYWNVLDFSNSVKNISIFNRFGKPLKIITPNSDGWDGSFNGQVLFADNYWYLISFQSGEKRRGHFILKR